MKQAPWIVADFAEGKTGECLRCGEILRLNLPQNLTVWVAAVRAFCKIHERCKERERKQKAIPFYPGDYEKQKPNPRERQ